MFDQLAKRLYGKSLDQIPLEKFIGRGRLIKVLDKKLYSVPRATSPQKKRLLNKIEPFKVLTK